MTQVDRIYSGRHINDQSVYHSDENNDDEGSSIRNTETIQEVRNGVVNERDLDLEKSQNPELEKTRTAKSNKSHRDPKLVSMSGPPNFASDTDKYRLHGMAMKTPKTRKTGL